MKKPAATEQSEIDRTIRLLSARVEGFDELEEPEQDQLIETMEEFRRITLALRAAVISKRVQKAAESGRIDTYERKKLFARIVNDGARSVGAAVKHPDTGSPCILLAIADRGDGSFVLEDRASKKRSRTTRDILTLLPFSYMLLKEDDA